MIDISFAWLLKSWCKTSPQLLGKCSKGELCSSMCIDMRVPCCKNEPVLYNTGSGFLLEVGPVSPFCGGFGLEIHLRQIAAAFEHVCGPPQRTASKGIIHWEAFPHGEHPQCLGDVNPPFLFRPPSPPKSSIPTCKNRAPAKFDDPLPKLRFYAFSSHDIFRLWESVSKKAQAAELNFPKDTIQII